MDLLIAFYVRDLLPLCLLSFNNFRKTEHVSDNISPWKTVVKLVVKLDLQAWFGGGKQ